MVPLYYGPQGEGPLALLSPGERDPCIIDPRIEGCPVLLAPTGTCSPQDPSIFGERDPLYQASKHTLFGVHLYLGIIQKWV